MRTTVLLLAGLLVGAVAPRGQEPEVYRPGNGVSMPTLVKEVKPRYTKEAQAAQIEGTVLLAVVILEDGTVGDTTVTRSLDAKFGLDAEAVKAAKQWMFKPGRKDGKPVRVLVTIEIAFTLK